MARTAHWLEVIRAQCNAASGDRLVTIPSPTRISPLFILSLYHLVPLPISIRRMPRAALPSASRSSWIRPGEYLLKAGS